MSDPRYSWWQQLLPFLRGTWTCPSVDVISALPRDRRKVTPVADPPPWPEALASIPVKFGGRRTAFNGVVGGKPVQYAGTATSTWTVADPWTHDHYRFQMPTPLVGASRRIVQGYPLRDGAFDRTSIVVDHDGVVETILTFPHLRRVGRMARWTFDGALVEGRPISRSSQPVFRTILGMDEDQHRLAMSVPDYSMHGDAWGGGPTQTDGTMDVDWPRPGSLVRLRIEALGRAMQVGGQVERVARMAHVHGVWIFDRSGPNVGHAAIHGQWGAWTEQHQPWTLADFEPATEVTHDVPRYGEEAYA